MDLSLKRWIEHNAAGQIASCYFCSNIGVVYEGIKPAEIIHVSADKLHQCVLLRDHLGLVILKKKNGRYSLFVYNPAKLEETLSKKSVLNHLKKLGYSHTFSLGWYVSTLISRLRQSNGFPHEIGFFLGYPAKDVLSFMGLIDLPFVKTMGWRMYGNTSSSELLYHQIKHAKDAMLHYAKQTQTKVC